MRKISGLSIKIKVNFLNKKIKYLKKINLK